MEHSPSRTLRLTSPFAHGEDVRRAQVACNARGRSQHLEVDGKAGPETLHSLEVCARALGIAEGGIRNGIGPRAQTIIRNPDLRNPVELYRAKARAKAAAKRVAQHGTGGAAVVAAALHLCRTDPQREEPPTSNRGPLIDKMQAGVDMRGLAWCGAFTHYFVKLVAGVDLAHAMRYCPTMESLAQHGQGGFREFIPAARIHEAPVGSILTWGRGEADHQSFLVEKVPVGASTVHDCGGNTSSGDGSPSDGGMTAEKWRPIKGDFPLRGACVWRGI